jgi:hypothetical protein
MRVQSSNLASAENGFACGKGGAENVGGWVCHGLAQLSDKVAAYIEEIFLDRLLDRSAVAIVSDRTIWLLLYRLPL